MDTDKLNKVTPSRKKDKKAINVLFGKKLAELRKARGLKQHDLSQQLGIHDQTTSRYERGEISPSLEILERIAKIFNVAMDYFITEQESDLIRIPVINSETPYVLNSSISKKLRHQHNLMAYVCENNNMSPVIQKDDIVIFCMNDDFQASLDQLVVVKKSNFAIKRISKITGNEVELVSTDTTIKPMT